MMDRVTSMNAQMDIDRDMIARKTDMTHTNAQVPVVVNVFDISR